MGMFSFLLAGVIGATVDPASSQTLAGVTLGATLANVTAQHRDAQVFRTSSGMRSTWNIPGAGTVAVLTDQLGKVVEADFVADQGKSGEVDLPCASRFPIQSSHVNFDMAAQQNTCSAIGDGTYRLKDSSILQVWFEGPGDGQLQEARWYHGAPDVSSVLPTARVTTTVFECTHDASEAPTLRLDDLDRLFASVPITPQWTFEAPVWKTTVAVPDGHYILHSYTSRCSGESEQLVAIPGLTRNVTITLDERHKQARPGQIQSVRVDEDMFASAVYGVLPTSTAKVDIMSASSVLGEQTRQTAKVDGTVYEADHLRPGRYILRIAFGEVIVSREAVIPRDVYGALVRADLTAHDAAEIVGLQAAGSGFALVDRPSAEKVMMFHRGTAVVDGWTNQLIPPSDYNTFTQRISDSVMRALDVTRRFLSSDQSIPGSFRSLSDWSAQITNGEPEVVVRLIPRDVDSWTKDNLKPKNCYSLRSLHYLAVAVNDQTWMIDQVAICP